MQDVKGSSNSRVTTALELSEKNEFILANFKMLWFDPEIVRLISHVCIWRKDRTGELRRRSRGGQ